MNTSLRNSPSTSWAWFGLAAMLAGYVATWLVVFLVSEDASRAGGAELIAEIESGSNELLFRVTSGLGLVAAALLMVYSAGVHRALASRLEPGSILPAIVSGSFIATAGVLAAGFIARGMVFDSAGWYGDDPRIAFYVTGVDVPLAAWSLLGVAAAVMAYASLRLKALPRWFGIVSLVAAALVLVTWAVGTLPPGNIPAGLWLITSVVAFRGLSIGKQVATAVPPAPPVTAS